ncbi:class I SAM-dependent methyltransferase [Marilutibacter aestuarii]|uniref:Class I SAM-dependent methyltransferase n=1 Tax=Marilutibacter aestuarii TaxID=1706195 RepID=A0A508A6K9_9GAMM|nr:class I SAM-dependent methyltransferase [Lysobacter aestuarii]TQD45556.1 class I SAM-dependent methyltransferase [Lysobacter aestuarii]
MHRWSNLADWRTDASRIALGEAASVAEAIRLQHLPGLCGVCGARRGFANADGNMREGLACLSCGCNARQRAATHALLALLAVPSSSTVRITEQASRLFLALGRRVRRLHGSEYLRGFRQRLRLSAWLWRHGAAVLVRHGDVTALDDPGESCDGVLSLDVLEHVSDYPAALREFARVLRPGGVLVLTLPFHDSQACNRRIARPRAGGGIEHFGAPEYHGDPLSGGVVCFHHFGWQLLEDLRAAGFHEAAAYRVHDPAAGLPQGQWVLVARR